MHTSVWIWTFFYITAIAAAVQMFYITLNMNKITDTSGSQGRALLSFMSIVKGVQCLAALLPFRKGHLYCLMVTIITMDTASLVVFIMLEDCNPLVCRIIETVLLSDMGVFVALMTIALFISSCLQCCKPKKRRRSPSEIHILTPNGSPAPPDSNDDEDDDDDGRI